jgi:hypothetical protein
LKSLGEGAPSPGSISMQQRRLNVFNSLLDYLGMDKATYVREVRRNI